MIMYYIIWAVMVISWVIFWWSLGYLTMSMIFYIVDGIKEIIKNRK